MVCPKSLAHFTMNKVTIKKWSSLIEHSVQGGDLRNLFPSDTVCQRSCGQFCIANFTQNGTRLLGHKFYSEKPI